MGIIINYRKREGAEMKYEFILIAVLFIGYLVYKSMKPKNIKPIDGESTKALYNSGATIVDVRTRNEYSTRHIPGSINIPVGSPLPNSKLPERKDAPIIVYCRSGSRAIVFEKTLLKEGYTNIYHLGSINKWKGDLS